MNYLAIDTSGTWLTVIVGGEKNAMRFTPDCRLSHSVVLMDEIEKCLEEAGARIEDIDVFACSVGAGSFTGIRIGVSTVKAFAYALGKKVLPVTTFDSLAYNIGNGKKRLALIDARHGNYYACGYGEDGTIVLPPKFIGEEEVKSLADGYLLVSDAPQTAFACVTADVADGFKKAVEGNLHNATYDRETVVPLYVKKSQAEEEL